jgi:hypothetical protein
MIQISGFYYTGRLKLHQVKTEGKKSFKIKKGQILFNEGK